MKKRPKIYLRKILCFSLTLLFSLSFFAATGFSNSDCGQMCCCSSKMNATQFAIKNTLKLNSDCCSQTPAHSCGLTGNHNVKLPICSLHAVRPGTNSSSCTTGIINGPIYIDNLILSQYGWHSDITPIQFTPIYLQHLSLQI
jgi:hypothetical protein